MADIQSIVDEYENIHLTSRELGRGGQGIVYRTKDPDIAIKLVLRDEAVVTDSEELRRFAERLQVIRTLPFPPGLPIASPVAGLQHSAGYVMQLLDEMVPFKSFWLDVGQSAELTEDAVPPWLVNVDRAIATRLIHYQATGGLRRRLVALYKCASIIARLHAAGLVYGDLSPANAFISGDQSYSQVWLIDADNVEFESADSNSGFFTPRYGAPELMQGLSGARFRTDCHSFATMAFYMLTLVHPFIGDRVEAESDWDAQADKNDELMERALAGHFPWVDDEADTSNATNNGLPRELVLSSELRNLFQETFGAGRVDYWRRPTIFLWPEVLARAADNSLMCPVCSMSYFSGNRVCPFCGAVKPEALKFETYSLPIRSNEPCWLLYREIPEIDEEILIPHRIFSPFSLADSDNPWVSFERTADGFLIKKDEMNELPLLIGLVDQSGSDFQPLSQYLVKSDSVRKGLCFLVGGTNPRLIVCRNI